MAGPRSISSSTRVAAPAGSGKYSKGKSKQRKGSKQKGSKKGAPPLPTWDHDNSSADDEPAAVATTTTTTTTATKATSTTAARKKRPRATVRFAESVGPDDDSAQKASTLKRRRPVKSKSIGGGDDEGSSSGGDGSEGEGGGEEDDEDVGGEGKSAAAGAAASAGGMGDVMARILGQKLDNRIQAPVLAKRKTKAMKEMERAGAKRSETRGKSAVRRANMTQQFVIPDHTTADYERQMKKIATRGVVALFNAISKRQNEGDKKNASGAVKSATVKGASRHAFLDMLKTGVKPGAAGAGEGEGGDGKRGGGGARGGAAGAGAGWDKDEGGQEGRSWSVLKEDYMMGASSMKNWDQESAESEADAVGGGDSMSDDDSD
ncbi:unnamed protein product [Laminaria digitata]